MIIRDQPMRDYNNLGHDLNLGHSHKNDQKTVEHVQQ